VSPSPVVLRFDTWIDPIFDRTLLEQPGLVLLRQRYAGDREENLAALARAHVLQVSPARDEVPPAWRVGDELVDRSPNLICVSSGGAGYDTVDVRACTSAGIAVVNQAGGNAVSVAEHTLGLMLAVTHRLAESDRRLRGAARGFSREDLMGRELHGKVLGLVGIGHTGSRVAALAGAFGMQVLATDPNLAPEEIVRRGATPVTFEVLLEAADIVSLHCPRSEETMRLMDAPAFARMKPGSVFISAARGGIHDEAALHEALSSGRLSGAGLDVWDVEPPAPDHPLLGLPNVVATFHTAGVTHEARRTVATMAAQQLLEVLALRRPPRLVNPEVWPVCAERLRQLMG
jgi:D-3-phosphoglycerate dehydrogenase / 2-oxoglutarate reductase